MELDLFSFQPGSSPLARVSPGLKLAALLVSVVLLLRLDLPATAILSLALAAISLPLGFSLKSQLQDFKPILFYIVMYYLAGTAVAFGQAQELSATLLVPTSAASLPAVRLLATVQLARFFYKTTTTAQLRSSLEKAEEGLRLALRRIPAVGRKVDARAGFAFSLTMVIAFIPRLMALWNQLELSWKARGGTAGLSMIRTLLPQLLVLALTDAESTWQAILNREAEEPSGLGPDS